MKRIYKNNDIIFNLVINGFPFNLDMITSIDFRFYTLNPSGNFIHKTKEDIVDASIILDWDELQNLEQGVMYYDYQLVMRDGENSVDKADKQMTNYYIMSYNEGIDVEVQTVKWGNIQGDVEAQTDLVNYINIKIDGIDLSKYAKTVDVDDKLTLKADKVHEHPDYVTNSKLNDYPTKSEVNAQIDSITAGEVSLQNYYTSGQTNNLLAEKADKVHKHPEYLTEHQSLANYPTKDEMNETIDKKITSGGTVDLSNYYKKDETYSQDEVNNKLANKANVSHEHPEYIKEIKTINGQSLVGSGNITIEGSGTVVGGVTTINGQTGDVTLTANDLNAYEKSETYSQSEIDDRLRNVTTDGVKRVNLTQSEYDQLSVKDNNTLYFITDAAPLDVVTNEELNAKNYLTEHQKLKTINGESLVGDGNIEIQGGGGTAGVTSINEKTGAVTLTAGDLDAYTKTEVNDKYDKKIEGIDKTLSTTYGIVQGLKIDVKEKADAIEVNNKFNVVNHTLSLKADKTELPDMTTYYTKQDINGKGYLTEEEIAQMGYLTSIPENYVTNETLETQGYLTSIPDEYVTEGDLDFELNSRGYLTEHQDISRKVDRIEITDMATTSWVNQQNYADKTSVQNKVEAVTLTQQEYDLLLDKQSNTMYIISDAPEGALKSDIADMLTKTEASSTYLTSIPENYVTNETLETKGYLTEHQDISGKADKTYVDNLIGGVNEKINSIKTMI